MYKATVCVPCYNCARTIRQTLFSILASTMPIKILIGNNCSEDGTTAILDEFERNFPNIQVFHHEKNLGYCGNISFLVQHAKTEYVAVFHSDDIYEPNIVEEEIRAAEKYDLDLVFVRMRSFFHGHWAKRKPGNYRFLKQTTDVDRWQGLDLIREIVLHWNFLPTPSLMIRRDVFLDLGGFSDQFPSNEDLDLWIRAAVAGKKFGMLRKYLLNYRRSSFNGSAMFNQKLRIPMYFQVLDYYNSKTSLLDKNRIAVAYRRAKALALVDLAFKFRNNSATKYLKALENARDLLKNEFVSLPKFWVTFPRFYRIWNATKVWLRT